MPVSLLRSKLFPPPLNRHRVPRERLLEALAAGRSRKVTLVSAPAGFGKSSLVAAWAETLPRVAWLSLDSGEDDLRRFLRYAGAALAGVDASLSTGVEEVLEGPRLPDGETLVARLTEAMHEKEPFLLVLDDYHTLNSPAVHGFVERLLAYQPRSLHLVLVTREDPPLPLARLRGRGELNEIRTRALRFTVGETRAFLNKTMGLALSEAQVQTLEERTEGWIAGLQLAALSLQRSDDPAGFVAAFAGDDRYVLDYLMDEVFARQPEVVQQFLLQTSVLERLSAGLCAAVIEAEELAMEDLSSLLAQLDRANLFVVPLDNRREWYRYHHLFADLLRYRLKKTQPGLEPQLHQRASRWYEAQGYLNEAVKHALRAGDDERVAHLIESHGAAFFAANEMKTVLAWIERLPTALVDNRPTLLMIQAWAALSSGQPEEAERSLVQIEASVGTSVEALVGDGPALDAATRGALAEVAITRAVIATDRREAQQAVTLAQQALSALEKETVTLFHGPPDLRGIALSPLASAYEMLGNVTAAREAMVEAAAISRQEENVHIRALATGRLGRLSALQGKLQQAERHYRDALAQTQPDGRQSVYRSVAQAGLGALCYERNELADAEAHFHQAISLAGPIGHWETLIPAYVGLTQIGQARGEQEAAVAALDELARLRHQFGFQEKAPQVEVARIRLALQQGKVSAAARRARHFARPQADLVPLVELQALARARVWLAQGQAEKALALVAPLVAQAKADKRQGRLLALLLLQALALDAAGRREEALDKLAAALRRGQEEGYVRVFLDEGERLARLLYAAVAADLAPAYGGRLLNAFEFAAEESRPAGEVVEPLTAREEEVLAAVAEGLTNREIAQALSIALGTVKVHTYNIYGKLGVGNRVEAVARARTLGILER